MSAFFDPQLKDLDTFIDVADRVDVEETIKFEVLESTEGNTEQ